MHALAPSGIPTTVYDVTLNLLNDQMGLCPHTPFLFGVGLFNLVISDSNIVSTPLTNSRMNPVNQTLAHAMQWMAAMRLINSVIIIHVFILAFYIGTVSESGTGPQATPMRTVSGSGSL